jgi:glucose-6-phosphate isomerase
MFPGSLHYIKGNTSHRVANTGESVLSFGACWPSDAGHDYNVIAKEWFCKKVDESKRRAAARVMLVSGEW